MRHKSAVSAFRAALPVLAKNGSLGFVTDFESNPSLAGAAGQVQAKTGTYVLAGSGGLDVKGQGLGGYIQTKSGRNLAYVLVVNNVQVGSITDLINIFQDEGTISAMLWRDY